MKKVIIVIIAIVIVAAVAAAAVYLPWSNEPPSDTTPQNETPTDGVVVFNPYTSGGEWYKGQMHCHSTQSDGAFAPRDVVSRYENLGYDFIALTDHEKITKVTGGILVLGQEYGKGSTESTGETHMNGINISYVPYKYAPEQERVDNMTAQGGIVTLNHPAFYKYAYEDEVMAALTDYTCLEIANGWIVVWTSGELTTESIIDAIKRGSFYASTGAVIDDIVVSGSNITVSTPGANNIRFFGSEGKLLAAFNGSQATYHFNGTEGYVRAVVGANDGWGWTQPVFVGPKASVPEDALVIGSSHVNAVGDGFSFSPTSMSTAPNRP